MIRNEGRRAVLRDIVVRDPIQVEAKVDIMTVNHILITNIGGGVPGRDPKVSWKK